MIKRILFYACCFLTVIAYACTYIHGGLFWPSGFLVLTLPFLGLFSLSAVLYAAYRRNKYFLLQSLLMLWLCLPALRATFGVSLWRTEAKENIFSVLSYNVNVLNTYAIKGKKNYGIDRSFLDWLVADTSSIKCFQEFYDGKGKRALSTIALEQEGVYHSFIFTPKQHRSEKFGLAIFSKFPIVYQGSIGFEKGSDNGIAFVDVALPSTDTIRVINAHLASMALDVDAIELKESVWERLFLKVKNGFEKRGMHSTLLNDLIDQTPYPIIVCGDLNELPYGFAYQTLRRRLSNAFESKGKGLELTFHQGGFPLLRLDQQFFSDEIEIVSFETIEKEFSDHYPVKGGYQLE